ncbi:hypothetical protein [Paenibacillus sp. FSL K6-1230]|uniref:hypothetical protein n=1 Tax=Paenibacillus sp. FSL K6-1230 TaxID=2921603 RepID=UPI0030F591F5
MKSLFKTCLMVFAFFLISTQMTFAADVDGMQGISPPEGTIATATKAYTTYTADKVLDKNLDTRWAAASRQESLELTFPQAVEMDFIQISTQGHNSNVSYIISGLQNGNWTVISPKATPGGVRIFDPIEVTKGSYDAIRIDVTEMRDWVSISEITLGNGASPEEPGTGEPTNPGEPGTEQPGTEQPGTEQPGTEQPGTEQPGTEQPGTEQPGTEEPGTEQPSGNRAIMVVTMTTGLEKEFDLSMKEVNNFIAWYEAKQAGSGKASYAIDKHDNNKGPFSSRKDYILYDRVLTFEVSEY